MRAVEPSEILLKTEKLTIVLEATGDRKIRFRASAWEDVRSSSRAKLSKFAVAVSSYCFCANRVILTQSRSGRSAEV